MAWKKQETNDRLRKTKVDAGLGPASWCEEKLKEMILAGTDILRLICSHRRGGDFERVYPLIQKIALWFNGQLQNQHFRPHEGEQGVRSRHRTL